MASDAIKKPLDGFGLPTNVTLPYAPTRSGILMISVNPSSSSSGAYVIVKSGTSSWVFSVGSGGSTGTYCLPVIKGITITETTKSNCSVSYYLCPLS